MNTDEAIAARRSVRDFTPERVDERTIHNLIDAAVRAPSAVNQQLWTFTVVRDQGVLDRISDGAMSYMLATAKENPYAAYFQRWLDDPHFHAFYHAPVLILISATRTGPWIVEDCTLAAANLMLAATAAGLGSCWIGFTQGFLNTVEGKRLLGLAEASEAVAPVIVGHPRGASPPVARNPARVHWIG